MSASKPSGPAISGQPDYYELLSWKIYQILEDIGANVKIRKRMTDGFNEQEEIATNAFCGPNMSSLYAGSQYEGTTTPGMDSDVDRLILNNLPVVTDPADHPVGTCLLLVQDATTHPGFCKLQLVENGSLIFGNNAAERLDDGLLKCYPDKNNRLVCTFDPHKIANIFQGRHGPALFHGGFDLWNRYDIVYALQCTSWPRCASEWLTRQRSFSWPSTEIRNLCSTLGCLFVPVGHPDSDEPNKEWRLSLTRQERLLVTSFNSVQLKCYVLLKIIKKDLIAPYIPDSLTSYHIKTCMLYLVENTSPEFWRPGNLLYCVEASLKLLSNWTEIGYCPNYFIPAENIFDRHVHGNVRQQLHQRLQLLISANFQFLVHIQTEKIGTYLQIHCVPSVFATGRAWYLEQVKVRQTELNLMFLQSSLYRILQAKSVTVWKRILQNRAISSLCKMLNDIRHNASLSSYTGTQTLLSSYIELNTMSNLIALAVHQGKPREQIWRYVASGRWHELCLQTDSFSPKLKQATFMYMLGYYYPSLDVLSSLSGLVRFSVAPYGKNNKNSFIQRFLPILDESEITLEELLQNYVVPSIDFPPTEKDVIPTALCYEMIRAEGQNVPNHLFDLIKLFDLTTDFMYSDWAFVDGQFLLHFLLYLNHKELSMAAHACADIDNMEWMLNTQDICHRGTCLNLLGWVYKEQGRVERAMECYRKSLEIKPFRNAAFWHIKDVESMNSHSAICL